MTLYLEIFRTVLPHRYFDLKNLPYDEFRKFLRQVRLLHYEMTRLDKQIKKDKKQRKNMHNRKK